MSCFICSKETKERVTAIIYNESFRPSPSSRLFWDQSEFCAIVQNWENAFGERRTVDEDNAEKIIFDMLSDMNEKAYDARYRRFSGRVNVDGRPPRGIYAPETIFSMETYKRLCCFNYQVDEDERLNAPYDAIYTMLKRIENALAQRLLFHLPEFERLDAWN